MRPKPPLRRAARLQTKSLLSRVRLVAVAAAVALPPAAALAQGAVDVNLMALEWARGQYRGPMVCQFDGAPVRALRRVLIVPAPPSTSPLQDRIQFPDSNDEEAPRIARCVSELGTPEPRVSGSIAITLRERSRPDTAQRDFAQALRRDGGFEYEILSGRLRIGSFGAEGDAPRDVDFAGGKARLGRVEPGSDAERMLADFDRLPGMTLEIVAPAGDRLVFHLVRIAGR